MLSLGWRMRMFARRAIPHTPAKRWGYAAAVALVLVAALLWSPLAGAAISGLVVVIRTLDLRRSRARRGRLPTTRAYFFEGDDEKPPSRRRR